MTSLLNCTKKNTTAKNKFHGSDKAWGLKKGGAMATGKYVGGKIGEQVGRKINPVAGPKLGKVIGELIGAEIGRRLAR